MKNSTDLHADGWQGRVTVEDLFVDARRGHAQPVAVARHGREVVYHQQRLV